MERVGFSLFLPLLGLAARVGNGIIIDSPRLINGCLLLLLRLVDFIERCLHRRWRPDGRELDLLDLKSQPILRGKIGQPLERRGFNIVPPNGQHFIHRAVADHFAHHAFREIAQRLLRFPRAEEIHFRIGDAVLHDPRDQRRIQVPGDHRLGVGRLRISLISVGRVLGRETELQFQQALRRDDSNFIDVRDGVGESGILQPGISPKAQSHTDRICRDRDKAE